jgi:hypothetical protein
VCRLQVFFCLSFLGSTFLFMPKATTTAPLFYLPVNVTSLDTHKQVLLSPTQGRKQLRERVSPLQRPRG